MSAGYTQPEVDLAPSSDARWALVQRIIASPYLKSSLRLCEFLSYVTDCAVRNTPEAATEQQIGVCVFGRLPGYNSSEDSIVRTHARLLRQRLAAYFDDPSVTEETILEIPKGHYLPVFRPRLAVQPEPPETIYPQVAGGLVRTDVGVNPTPGRKGKWLFGGISLLLLLLVSVAILHTSSVPVPAQSPVETFWHPFLTGDPPLVIYSNALFAGNSERGLHYAAPGTVVQLDGDGYVDTYTGVGELDAVHMLTRVFDQFHSSFVLKRSLLVTWDEAQLRDLIFIGSRAENPALRVLPQTTDFSMITGRGFSGIVNHHPLPGESALFSRPEHPLTRDYAILALLPGVTQGRRILIFSGLMTYGTQAAVEYVCQPATVSKLLRKIRGPNGEIRPFEAVLEVDIGGGVPLKSHLVAIRVH